MSLGAPQRSPLQQEFLALTTNLPGIEGPTGPINSAAEKEILFFLAKNFLQGGSAANVNFNDDLLDLGMTAFWRMSHSLVLMELLYDGGKLSKVDWLVSPRFGSRRGCTPLHNIILATTGMGAIETAKIFNALIDLTEKEIINRNHWTAIFEISSDTIYDEGDPPQIIRATPFDLLSKILNIQVFVASPLAYVLLELVKTKNYVTSANFVKHLDLPIGPTSSSSSASACACFSASSGICSSSSISATFSDVRAMPQLTLANEEHALVAPKRRKAKFGRGRVLAIVDGEEADDENESDEYRQAVAPLEQYFSGFDEEASSQHAAQAGAEADSSSSDDSLPDQSGVYHRFPKHRQSLPSHLGGQSKFAVNKANKPRTP